MFHSFFLNKKWWAWSLLGTAVILLSIWYKVELDVQINEWFGSFYDGIQEILKAPNSVTFPEFLARLMHFSKIAGIYIALTILLEFFSKHYIFRWRTAMTEHYLSHWDKVRHIEGASQRIQEDTMRFAKIMEALGESFIRSVLTLVAFLPMLNELSKKVPTLPWVGEVPHSLVLVALLFSIFGTVVLAAIGVKLPGLEYNNQRVEAAFRKELVLGEDNANRAQPETLRELFQAVRKNNFVLYAHYLYFDLARWSYLQFAVIVPYIALAPSLLAGALSLGVLQQVVRAFGKVQDSFQFLVQSWTTIVELLSIYKRLKGFEQQIKVAKENAA
ncbi:putative transporter [Kingella negevensis]|uniref:Peptide antibiotic transporter SbmA n=1 Tax=Kingella negevensis TaxID=1522312 RepID=A0A238HI64_9NEIS|nr:putative transporter [Kingella negevensis]MDK4679584.1 putative transporter [Kingella negevensis]MDK4682698.1 putative transporter [Kingella negevensis]MDK4685259.1 putative transporter [Kingella negevensis]MDK4690895.1 putative transporter [Kingella negevensis]MDK4693958.1 putative transporter [Kingella negevensis]